MSSLPDLRALLIDEIKDLHHAESQLTKALPKMVKAATDPALKAGFSAHLEQTREHVERLVEALKILDLPPKGKVCHAMKGLLEEASEVLSADAPSAVRDAALIGAAQRVEHYEMAAYGTACAFAEALGETRIAELLRATLEEEKVTNENLTEISRSVNANALSAEESSAETASKPKRKPAKR